MIIRRERDVPALMAALAAGDPIPRQFFTELAHWLKHSRTATPPPLCLACEHEFAAGAPAPGTFGMSYSEDPRVKQLVMTGVCAGCAAAKSDTELIAIGAEGLCKAVDGRVVGFTHTPASPVIH